MKSHAIKSNRFEFNYVRFKFTFYYLYPQGRSVIRRLCCPVHQAALTFGTSPRAPRLTVPTASPDRAVRDPRISWVILAYISRQYPPIWRFVCRISNFYLYWTCSVIHTEKEKMPTLVLNSISDHCIRKGLMSILHTNHSSPVITEKISQQIADGCGVSPWCWLHKKGLVFCSLGYLFR